MLLGFCLDGLEFIEVVQTDMTAIIYDLNNPEHRLLYTILAEGAIARPVTLCGGVLIAS